MLKEIEQLIVGLSELQSLFYSNIVNDLTHNINFSKKQINHLHTDTNLFNNFFKYLDLYSIKLIEFVNTVKFDQFLDQYVKLHIRSRVKDTSSLEEKITRHYRGAEKGKVPIQKCINDIMGFRVITDIDYRNNKEFKEMLESLKNKKIIYYFYVRKDGDYHGIHLYFKNKSNLYLPWELQIWYNEHVEDNYKSHYLHKQGYLSRGE